nr:hemin uptake protein HemP [Thermomonas aquatica]
MQPAAPVAAPAGSAVDSQRLLQGRSEVLIRHGNETYRLRHTRNDKLILTK